jgi:hypothetical protein
MMEGGACFSARASERLLRIKQGLMRVDWGHPRGSFALWYVSPMAPPAAKEHPGAHHS